MAFTIGELAREFGVSLRTIRFYEDKQLLQPRREGLARIYSRRDRARLKLILTGKKVGFSLGEIKTMLDVYDLRDGQADQLRTALDKFGHQIARLEAQRDEIERAIGELRRTREVVAGLLRTREDRAGDQLRAGS